MKINFFVADEFRAEAGGKQMAVGLYADNVIILEPRQRTEAEAKANLPDGIDRLGFLISVSEVPEKTHTYKAQIIDPSGTPHGPEIPLGDHVIPLGTSRNFVLEAKPFLVDGKGTYRLNFFIDDVAHPFEFKIINREQFKPSAP